MSNALTNDFSLMMEVGLGTFNTQLAILYDFQVIPQQVIVPLINTNIPGIPFPVTGNVTMSIRAPVFMIAGASQLDLHIPFDTGTLTITQPPSIPPHQSGGEVTMVGAASLQPPLAPNATAPLEQALRVNYANHDAGLALTNPHPSLDDAARLAIANLLRDRLLNILTTAAPGIFTAGAVAISPPLLINPQNSCPNQFDRMAFRLFQDPSPNALDTITLFLNTTDPVPGDPTAKNSSLLNPDQDFAIIISREMFDQMSCFSMVRRFIMPSADFPNATCAELMAAVPGLPPPCGFGTISVKGAIVTRLEARLDNGFVLIEGDFRKEGIGYSAHGTFRGRGSPSIEFVGGKAQLDIPVKWEEPDIDLSIDWWVYLLGAGVAAISGAAFIFYVQEVLEEFGEGVMRGYLNAAINNLGGADYALLAPNMIPREVTVSPEGIIMQGQVVPLEPQSAFWISPVVVDMGNVRRGTVATRDHVFTVSSGSSGSSVGAGPVTIQSVTLQGPQAAAFSVALAAGNPFPLIMQPGDSFTIGVSFASTALGQHMAAVVVTGLLRLSAAPTMVRAPVVANSVAPLIDVLPSSVNFGNQIIGQPATRNMLITNSGAAELRWRIAAAIQHQFKWPVNLSNAWQTLASGAAYVVQLTFEPTIIGNHSDLLNVESDDRTVTVPLFGVGVPAPVALISVTPDPVTFGLALIGGSVSRNATISNAGDAPLTVTNVALTGSAAFSLPQIALPFDVDPLVTNPSAGNRLILVTFHPQTADDHNGTLHISSNAPTPVVTVQLQGTTPAADVLVSMAAINYGTLSGMLPRTRNLLVYNVGAAPMTCSVLITNERNNATGASVDAFRIQGSWLVLDSGASQVVPFDVNGKSLTIPPTASGPSAIPLGANLSLDLVLAPGGLVGSLRADLVISTNDPGTPTVTVSLQGVSM